MEMHQIRYFLAVARTLNFTRAAEESNVTQPSLTRAIQKLEEEFGGLLFRRERALTHLTDLGKQMQPHLERMLESAQLARSLAKGIGKAAATPLHLGLAETAANPRLNETFAELAASLPGFQLRIASGDAEMLIQELMKGDIELVICTEPRQAHDRLDAIELFRQDFGVAVPAGHPLAACAAPTMADLHELCWIEGTGDLRAEFRDICAGAAIEPDFRHLAATNADVARLVAAGLGCALLPRGIGLAEGIGFIEPAGLALSRRVVVASMAGRKRSTASDALVRAIRTREWP